MCFCNLQERLVLWDKLKAQYDAELQAMPEKTIIITLPDGKEVEGLAWKTSPYDVAKGIRYK